MKFFKFRYETGPVAYDCHETVIEAINYSQARRLLREMLQSSGDWENAKHNIYYDGLMR